MSGAYLAVQAVWVGGRIGPCHEWCEALAVDRLAGCHGQGAVGPAVEATLMEGAEGERERGAQGIEIRRHRVGGLMGAGF